MTKKLFKLVKWLIFWAGVCAFSKRNRLYPCQNIIENIMVERVDTILQFFLLLLNNVFLTWIKCFNSSWLNVFILGQTRYLCTNGHLFNPLMPDSNKKITQVCWTFLLPPGIKGLTITWRWIFFSFNFSSASIFRHLGPTLFR